MKFRIVFYITAKAKRDLPWSTWRFIFCTTLCIHWTKRITETSSVNILTNSRWVLGCGTFVFISRDNSACIKTTRTTLFKTFILKHLDQQKLVFIPNCVHVWVICISLTSLSISLCQSSINWSKRRLLRVPSLASVNVKTFSVSQSTSQSFQVLMKHLNLEQSC